MPHKARDIDQLLVQKIKEGDQQAFKELFDKYWDKLFAVAINRLQSGAVAEDLIQQLFTDIWARRKTLEINTSVSAYLYAALRYLIIGHINKSSCRNKYIDVISRQYETNELSTEAQVSYNQLNEELDRQVDKLPDRCRQVFMMSRFNHRSHKEIAEELGISYKTVEGHIGRALKKMRPALTKVVSILPLLLIG